MAKSGEKFFCRNMQNAEKPSEKDRLLEIKVMWGGIVLDVRHFAEDETVTVGALPEATFRIITTLPGEQTFTLVGPGGAGGHVVNAERSMEMEIRRNGRILDPHQLPSTGTVRAHALGLNDRCRVIIGQLAFVIQYIPPTPGMRSKALAQADLSLAKWVVVFLILALGLWTAVQLTPPSQADVTNYIKNPSRFAGMIVPSPTTADKRKFAVIEERKHIAVTVKNGEWNKSENRKKAVGKNIPRKIKEERDREVALSSGLLDLLRRKKPGDGAGSSPGGDLFQGSPLVNIDQELEGIQAPGTGDTGGVGGLRPGGGRAGVGGDAFSPAGGDDPFGRPGDREYSSVDIARPGKGGINVIQDPKRTKLLGDGLSRSVVGRYIERRWLQFKHCYEKELNRDPNLWGKLTATFTISGTGRVSDAQVLTTSLNNANVESCVLGRIRSIRFPQPKGGGEVIVTYPFLFTTTQ
jgi:hypothetical protein